MTKASELTPGDTITSCESQPDLVGWTVDDVHQGCVFLWHPEIPDDVEYSAVLLTLERTWTLMGSDGTHI